MKEELQGYLLQMIEPLKKYYSDGKAELDLGAFAAGYGMKIAKMEGISRILWGLTPYWVGGGKEEEFRNIYKSALISGTNPESKEYWGDLSDNDQRMVEMAAISLNLIMTPEAVWEQLKKNEKENVAKWLYQINNYTQPDNNWNFFNVITNVALKKCGMPYSEERMQYGIERYEQFYLGNGWYSDGVRPQKDYYVSFGIHFYCLLYAKFMEEDKEHCTQYKERAKKFAETFLYWFDDEGKALPFGRSQTYRFAQVAFWSVFAAVVGEECPYLGVVKGIIARHFRYWMKQPIFDYAGLLTVGYTYPNLIMSEGYNSPSSPYWALKAFLCLSLSDDHTFWKAEEEELPPLAAIKRVKECDMLIQHRKGEVSALTAGQYPTVEHTHAPAKYSKFAYSSRLGFSVPRSNLSVEDCAPDSMLAFQCNGMIYVRRKCLEYKVEETAVYSKWSPVDGITVETTLIPTEKGHIRKHNIKSRFACVAYECGFSYPFGNNAAVKVDGHSAKIYDENGYSLITSEFGAGKAIRALPNTNLIFPLTQIPSVVYEIKEGEQEVEAHVMTEMKEGLVVIGKGDCYELQVKR
ncbi:DUF2264 domain-containing protein [Konateibacter massiliensis]|uniref:DUF2264 domain-containing protein n=1 Tax=Konateibacter massiliensis TaxID=2002841 RepID=UPI000C15B74D|nr:DUF2264 domain-containing protein [Konateibacter massiliensis]